MTRRDLFGGWYMGWIARGPYLKALALWLVPLAPLVLIGRETATLGYYDLGGWGSQAQAAHTIAALAWVCFVLNLIVRRLRDAGLPGWLMGAAIVGVGFAILRHFFVTAGILGLMIERITAEGLAWSGAWVGAVALVAAIIPTDFFPWVVDRDRWAVFD